MTVYPSASGPAGGAATAPASPASPAGGAGASAPGSPAGGAPSKPYGTAAPSASAYVPSYNNSTIPFTGAASAQKAGGLLMAIGLVAALL